MVTDRNIFVFAMLTLLSYSIPSSSFFLPRITRTNDAIIIDFAVLGTSTRHQNYRDIFNSGFVPVPAFNPAVEYKQPKYSNGLFYSYGSLFTPATSASSRQNVGFTPCGRGPTTFPTSRSSINQRIAADRSSTDKNVWPFVVTLASYFEGVVCGGSLISESKVLLASQCLQRMSLSEMSFLTVLIGMQLNDVGGAQITRRVTKIVLHSKFNALYFTNDIAIITLDAPVTFSRTISPVCLPPASNDPDQYADQDAIILGWAGTSTGSDTLTPYLEHGKATIVSGDDCRAITGIGQYVSNTTICTSPISDFACTGDIGGPVVVMSSPGNWTVVGINSYYKNCGSNSLETRVSAFRAWIDTYILI